MWDLKIDKTELYYNLGGHQSLIIDLRMIVAQTSGHVSWWLRILGVHHPLAFVYVSSGAIS